jgi:hypothetical protein
MFLADFELKELFFDRPAVQARVDRAKLQTLRHAGGAVRLRARRSLKRSKKPAPPDSPPRVHTKDGTATLKNIQFALADEDTVVIGPIGLAGKRGRRNSRGSVPALLELGGTAMVLEKLAGTKWIPVGRHWPHPGQPVRKRLLQIYPRPFMAPALAEEAPRFPNLFARSLSG